MNSIRKYNYFFDKIDLVVLELIDEPFHKMGPGSNNSPVTKM